MDNQIFVPSDWYWSIAGDTSQFFSSASGGFVQNDDATYLAWVAAGNTVTNIASKQELGEVLSQYEVEPIESEVLDSYRVALAEYIPRNVLLKIILNHENRIRTLEGNGTITMAQLKAAIKSLI